MAPMKLTSLCLWPLHLSAGHTCSLISETPAPFTKTGVSLTFEEVPCLILCRDNCLTLKGCLHGMPGKACALDTGRKVSNAGKYCQASKLIWRALFIQLARNHTVKFLEESLRLFPGFSLYALGHHA